MTDSYAGFGGIAQHGRDMLDSLNSSSEVSEIRSITRHPGKMEIELPDKLTESCNTGRLGYLASGIRQAHSWRPDVIYCGHLNLLPAAAIASLLIKFPIVLAVHGIEAWEDKGWEIRFLLKKVNHVIAVSRYTKRRFLSWAKMDEKKVDVVPNAIHLNRYVMTEKPDELIQRYSLKNRRVLLTLARLSSQEKYKGHDRIISLLPKLVGIYPNLIYMIAGDGDDRARLEMLSKELGVSNFVKFVGRVAEDEILDHYNVADAFAMPSTGEGFGIVFLEAAACGLPVLGGGVDGSADALLDGELGIMIDPEDKVDLFEGLVRLLHEPVKYVHHKKLGIFSFDRFKSQILNFFLEASSHRK